MASAHSTGQQPTRHPPTAVSDSLTYGVDDPRSGEQPRAFVSRTTGLLAVIGRDGCFKRLTPTFPPAFGFSQAELLEQLFIAFIHPADQPATRSALERLAQGEPTIDLENRFAARMGHSDGLPGWRCPRLRDCSTRSHETSRNTHRRRRRRPVRWRASKPPPWH